jgi:dihydropyrimidinase/allantoinase
MSAAIVLALAEEMGTRVQVVHCSSPRTARLARDARRRGVDATVETCPPYLFFTDEALDRLGPFAKCNPPLRSAADVAALRTCVREGLIAVIGTDHSPFLAEDKARGADNIFLAPPGLCGLEVMVPLMLTAVHDGWLTIEAVAALLSENAARLFHLPAKGRLAPGADADVTIVDLGARWTYDSSAALTRSRANMRIYDGVELHGRVVHTIVRGVPVYRDGALVGTPGHGRFVAPVRAD